MGYEIQITVDAKDPHLQAKWWAQTLGWEVEPSDEQFIRGLVEAGHAQESDTTVFEVGSSSGMRGRPSGTPSTRSGPGCCSNWCPRAKRSRTGCISTLRVGDRREEWPPNWSPPAPRSCIAAGRAPSIWITMTDPEGNEFCVG